MRAVDPLGQFGVMALVHQQRLRKPMQHALDGTAPGGIFLTHLDQFADEGQRGFGNAGFFAQACTQGLHRRSNVGGIAGERLDLGAHLRKALAVLALAGDTLADRLVLFGGQPLPVLERGARLRGLLGKSMRVVGQSLVELAAGLFGLGTLVAAACKFALDLELLAFQRVDPLAALAAALGLQIGQALLVVIHCSAALALLAGQALVVDVQCMQARIQQRKPALLAIGVQAELEFLQAAALTLHRLQVLVMRTRGQQRFDLPPCGDHRQMRSIEFGEVAHQPLAGVKGLGRLEHEAAQEHIEIAEILRGLGFMQQP